MSWCPRGAAQPPSRLRGCPCAAWRSSPASLRCLMVRPPSLPGLFATRGCSITCGYTPYIGTCGCTPYIGSNTTCVCIDQGAVATQCQQELAATHVHVQLVCKHLSWQDPSATLLDRGSAKDRGNVPVCLPQQACKS